MKNANSTFKKNIASFATAGALGLAAIAAGSIAGNTNSVSAATSKTVVVNTNSATVYTAANGASTGKTLPNNSSWKTFSSVKGSDGKTWYNVGGDQWVSDDEVNIQAVAPAAPAVSSTQSKINAVINLAKKEIGKPYVWGAKGPNAFDCSGLMHYIFQQAAGKEIGGWTVPQESAGTKVSISSLKAGDLVFWGSRGATYHVALYVGNGQYIEAPKPGLSVRYSKLSSYFMPSFGVRVF